ncbi:MAG: hypothetical protein IT164_11000 [Bryobacterales bacterium]|nr:hypothetical protein [Bryobacterales bacterium]
MRTKLTSTLFLALTALLLASAPAQEIRYSYDGAGRLVRAEYGSGRAIGYTYNPAGDLTRRAFETGAASSGFVSVSSASFAAARPLSPGIIASGFGVGLATGVAANTQATLPTTLLGTSVAITDSAGVTHPAPLFAVSPTQINYLVPAAAALGKARITVTTGAGATITGAADIAPVSPGLYTANLRGTGVASAFSLTAGPSGAQTQSLVFDPVALTPVPVDVRPGEQVYLLLFGTGIRGYNQEVTATLGGVSIPVLGAVAQGQFAGLDQVNIGPLPASFAPRGELPLVLTADGLAANTVTITVR